MLQTCIMLGFSCWIVFLQLRKGSWQKAYLTHVSASLCVSGACALCPVISFTSIIETNAVMSAMMTSHSSDWSSSSLEYDL